MVSPPGKKRSRAATIALAVLEAPAWIAYGVFTIIAAPARVARWIVRLRRATSDRLTCPAGHPNRVDGRWECRCGYVYVGHAFAPCANCGSVAGWFPCECCGLGVRSPAR